MFTIHGISYEPVGPSEKFHFQCIQCGNCCKHLRMAVLLESIDAFRLARLLKSSEGITGMPEIWERYAAPIFLTETGYPAFFIKTVGEDERCIFLQDNLCRVQEAKPRICRLYPLSVNPAGCSPHYALSLENPHHFSGKSYQVRNWAKKNMFWQERVFINEEAAFLPQIGKMLSRLTKEQRDKALPFLMLYRYYRFDLERDFFPQYVENNLLLFQFLEELSKEK